MILFEAIEIADSMRVDGDPTGDKLKVAATSVYGDDRDRDGALVDVMLSERRDLAAAKRFDETYIRVQGTWKYLYRAIDIPATADFAFPATAQFLRQRGRQLGFPEHAEMPQRLTGESLRSGSLTRSIRCMAGAFRSASMRQGADPG